MTTASNLDIARQYLAALEVGGVEGKLAYFAPDVVQQEWPNRLSPNGATRDLAALREAAERGAKVVSAERYDVQAAIASGDLVALEVLWTGTLAVAFDTIPAGGQLRARLAIFLEFRNGKIIRQRSYDCFEPW